MGVIAVINLAASLKHPRFLAANGHQSQFGHAVVGLEFVRFEGGLIEQHIIIKQVFSYPVQVGSRLFPGQIALVGRNDKTGILVVKCCLELHTIQGHTIERGHQVELRVDEHPFFQRRHIDLADHVAGTKPNLFHIPGL
jgi:hypothetical protein